MRPAILQWKVCLALLAVVGIGVTLGSVLHSTPKYDEPRLFAVSHLRQAVPGTATGGMTPLMRREECAGARRGLRAAHGVYRGLWRQQIRVVCRHR
jgi:hypothetical protein